MTDIYEPLTTEMLDALRPTAWHVYGSGLVALRNDVGPVTAMSLIKRGYAHPKRDGKFLLTPKGERASAWLNVIGRDLGAAIAELAEHNEEGPRTK